MSKTQVQKILEAVTRHKLNGCEFAVVAKLLTLPEYKIGTAKALHGKWPQWDRFEREEAVKLYGPPLPHSKASIYRAIAELKKRGWLEEKFAHQWQRTDGELSIVPMLILGDKPGAKSSKKKAAIASESKKRLASIGKLPKRSTAAKKKTAKKTAVKRKGARRA